MTTLLLDVDDVILDWQGQFVMWMRHEKGVELDPAGPQTWDLCAWVGENAAALVVEFNDSPWFRRMTFLPGVMEFFVAYDRMRIRPRLGIITACGDSAKVVDARLRGLRPVRDLIFDWHFLPLGAKKKDVLKLYMSSAVLVEDNFGHARDAVDLGMQAFVFRRGHNRSAEANAPADESLMWIDTWQPVLDYISRNTGESHETVSGVRIGGV